MCRYLTYACLIFVLACSSKPKEAYQFTDSEFEQILLEVELAKESMNTSSIEYRDSFFHVYLDAIALRHETTAAVIIDEIHLRLTTQEDFDKIYERLLPIVDSLEPGRTLQ